MAARQRTFLIEFLLLALAGALPAADDFPYEAYVAVDGAEIVAGPGHRFYATQRLARGTKIEIFREEPSGWLAIRPPEDAFSWVPATSVEISKEEEKLGRVKEAVAAWIGTAVERVSEHRQQVTLKLGEVVQILGQKSVPDKDGASEVWLKIAPPAGEFRWIHLRDVSRQIPEPAAQPNALPAEETENIEPGSPSTIREDLPTENEEPREPRRLSTVGSPIMLRDIEPAHARNDSRVAPTQYQGSRGVPETRPISPDGFVARKRRSDGAPQSESPSPITGARSLSSSVPRPRSDSAARIAANERLNTSPSASSLPASKGVGANAAISGDEITRQLDQFEVELSLMLAQEKSLWNLASLRERLEKLVAEGGDPVSRGRARLVLDKIKQFEGAFHVEDFGPIRPGASAGASTTASTADKGSSSPLTDPRYDAQGWLKPVISRKGNKPAAPYAIVDQDGKPICFITPTPGLNLQSYLNKQVGIYGRRGYLEELKKSHLTAERVIDLDRQYR